VDAFFVALLHSRCSLCVTQKRNKKRTAYNNVTLGKKLKATAAVKSQKLKLKRKF
jgi:hypothetical protein